jgi:hypothetical protein
MAMTMFNNSDDNDNGQDPSSDKAILDMSPTEILSTHWPSWFTECANYLWFLLEVDVDDKVELKGSSSPSSSFSSSGLGSSGATIDNEHEGRQFLKRVKRDFLDVLEGRIAVLRKEMAGSDLSSHGTETPLDDDSLASSPSNPQSRSHEHEHQHGRLGGFEAEFDRWADSLQRARKAVNAVLGEV